MESRPSGVAAPKPGDFVECNFGFSFLLPPVAAAVESSRSAGLQNGSSPSIPCTYNVQQTHVVFLYFCSMNCDDETIE